jgi:pimeloyl-ACP methyl ester carboxylesterase
MSTITAPNSTQSGTQFATSADGTRIAYEVHGVGFPLILVDGAMCQRTMGPSAGLAKTLSADFAVHVYDRRGRGESEAGATAWSLDREIEDLAAIVDAAGGVAHVMGVSSGAAISLEAAAHGVAIDRLVVYEAPFIVDETREPQPADAPEQMQRLVDRGARSEAVKTFMRTVGLPAPFIGLMRILPAWKKLTGIAHTLPYDYSIVTPYQQGEPLPDDRYAAVTQETLVIAGGRSPEHMRNAQAAIAAAVPNARLKTLPRQTHLVKPKVTGPVVKEFLLA